ncbi:MAG: ABC transporter ATP-binding protein [Planctomycetes bacterium]|nr:ABC transporter ATP-binding protein [Planctomycetota bacterium]
MTRYPIEFDDVQRWFADRPVLRGLSCRVEPGTVYALLGRNGSGKTTALRILLGFLQPHHGTARLFGEDCTALSPQLRGRVGYIGEDHRLYPTMSVTEAVAFEAGTRPGFRRDFAEAALKRCGLAGKHRIPRLSRGQRAQLSVVLAVAGNPEVLICDDPALGLDVVMRRELLDVMIELLADTGSTVLFSSHFLTDVERIADRIGILHDGCLLVDATLADLERRVRRCAFVPDDGTAMPVGADILRVRKRRTGVDLLLLDADAERLATLRRLGELSEPAPLSLEDLFLDLVGPEHGVIDRAAALEEAS